MRDGWRDGLGMSRCQRVDAAEKMRSKCAREWKDET